MAAWIGPLPTAARTSGVRGGKYSNEKKGSPLAIFSLTLSMIFMVAAAASAASQTWFVRENEHCFSHGAVQSKALSAAQRRPKARVRGVACAV